MWNDGSLIVIGNNNVNGHARIKERRLGKLKSVSRSAVNFKMQSRAKVAYATCVSDGSWW